MMDCNTSMPCALGGVGAKYNLCDKRLHDGKNALISLHIC